MLPLLKGWRTRRGRIMAAEDLRRFMGEQAAFVSQKCAVEYCRQRSGHNWDLLVKEQPFAEALAVCRWEGFAAVLGDLAIITEARLRPYAGARTVDLADRLAEQVGSILAEHPLPVHRPGGWAEEVEALRQRLAKAQLTTPEPVHTVGFVAGRRIFRSLPIHPSLRRHDLELVQNNVRFNLCRSYEDMCARIEVAKVATDLVGDIGNSG